MKNFTFFVLWVFIAQVNPAYSQNESLAETSMSAWGVMFQHCGTSAVELRAESPGIPDPDAFERVEDFTQAVHSWFQRKPSEVKAFWSNEKIKACNPSPYYLGIKEPEHFDNAMWEWVSASGISDTRLHEIAPNFPNPDLTQNFDSEEVTYQSKLNIWSLVYPLELEALVNAKELISLNPYYESYVPVSIVPRFVGSKITDVKPVFNSTGNTEVDEIDFHLRMQNWLFIYHPKDFEKQYGYKPRFPEWYDTDTYRQETLEKIKMWKDAQKQ